MEERLAKMQLELDELYKKEGFTDEVLEKQVEINTLRHEYNIPDSKNTVHEEFVQ